MLSELGFDIWGSETPSVPIVVGEKRAAYEIWKMLRKEGLFTTVSLPPAVPPKKDLIRTAITAGHSDADLDTIATAFSKVAKKFL